MINNLSYLKFASYYRKSSEGDDRQIASIEDQKAEMQLYAKNNNLNIVKEFSEAHSAKDPGRIEFNKLIQSIYKGEIDGIICWSLNRLSRNPLDGGQVQWLLQQGHAKAIITHNRTYLPEDNTVLMAVELGVATQYIRDLSIDTKRGLYQKAQRGWYPTSILPIGYSHNLNKTDAQEIIPDPKRFEIIKKLWSLFLSGNYSITEIHRVAYEKLGLRNRYGKSYSVGTISALLRNEFYAGTFHWKDNDGINEMIQGKHQSMISTSQFHKAQIILQSHSRNTRKTEYHFPYKDIIRCGECNCFVSAQKKVQIKCSRCGTKFSAKHQNRCSYCHLEISKMTKAKKFEYIYYGCSKGKRKSGVNCSQKNITKEILESQILEELKVLQIMKPYKKWLTDLLKTQHREFTHCVKENIKLIDKEITRFEHQTNLLINMRTKGEISSNEYLSVKQEYRSEIEKLILQKKSFTSNENNTFCESLILIEFCSNGYTLFKKGNEKIKNEIFHQLAQNQILFNKKLSFKRSKELNSLIDVCSELDEIMAKNTSSEPMIILKNIAETREKSPYLDSSSKLLAVRVTQLCGETPQHV